MIDAAPARRRSHVGAAVQPSSRMTSVGAEDATTPLGAQTGPAIAKINAAASASRSAISHQGVFAGVSSSGLSSRRIFVGGKTISRGRGGVTRNSQ